MKKIVLLQVYYIHCIMAITVDRKQYSFSGHESFPCKTLWLKKGYDFVTSNQDFNAPEAVVSLGVGKNMVAAGRDNLFNENTVKKDVGVLLLNYCLPRNPQSNEDFSTLLMDLDLLRQTDRSESAEGKRNRYFFNIEGKRQVTPAIFLFALLMVKEENDNSNLDICTLLEVLNKKMTEQ